MGLAVIASEQARTGNMLGVAVGGGIVPATVDVLPIYDTQKRPPAPSGTVCPRRRATRPAAKDASAPVHC